MKRDEFQAELDRIDRQRRGDPLTPEGEARIRAQERRWSEENRIRRDEWAKALGFSLLPHLVSAGRRLPSRHAAYRAGSGPCPVGSAPMNSRAAAVVRSAESQPSW